MKIIIPTYRRVTNQSTFLSLPDSYKVKTTFVVDSVDAKNLKVRLGITDEQILIHPENVKSIAQKRAFIIEYFNGKILMLDDDLRFANRIAGTTKLEQATKATIEKYFKEIEDALDIYVHVGISARQGNNNLEEKWVKNTRMMYALGYWLPTVNEVCSLGRIETREDMDYTLQLLKAGYPNVVLSELCVDQKYNSPGGASTERTVESSNRDAERLAELHPGIVKVVEKNYEKSIPRKEVICYWKKAFGVQRSEDNN